jgi:hypothetical protein
VSDDELMTESELDATLAFWSLATQYADACLQRRALKRKVPQCIYYAIWQTYRYDWDTPSGEVEKPCYMQSVRTAVDRFDPLPLEERCEPCQERAKLQAEIGVLGYTMGSLKRKMLIQRVKMNPAKDKWPLDATPER